jgi:hypothetical protein
MEHFMFYLKVWNIGVVLLALCFSGCARTTEKSNEFVFEENLPPDLQIESKLAQLNLSRDRGHIVFKSTITAEEKIIAFSVEQPDAKLLISPPNLHILVDLVPQKHTLVVERVSPTGRAFAVLQEIELARGQYAELGELPFEKPGVLRGRVLRSSNSQPLQNALVRIPQLNLSRSTNSQGEFIFESLPPGQWTASIYQEELGRINDLNFNIQSEVQSDAGDFWIGETNESRVEIAEVDDATKNYISERTVTLRLQLSPSARSVVVRDSEGNALTRRIPAQQMVRIELPRTGKNELRIVVFDGKGRQMGVLTSSIFFDPFAVDGKLYQPQVKIAKRVINSPARTITINLENIPANAKKVRFGIDDKFGEWISPENQISLDLPKSNKSCGQKIVSVQYQTAAFETSETKRIPVTLSCWQRIPHRAMISKLVGLENASAWTGTHAFVWSGKQLDTSNRSIMNMGTSNSENDVNANSLQNYTYLDGGYLLKPSWNAESNTMGRVEFESIVTDNAPQARSQTGTGGLGQFVAVYGGENRENIIADGGIYDIENNGWISMSGEGAPSPRIKPSVFFIAPRKVLVWGGRSKTNLGFEIPLNDGAIYDIDSHVWTPISTINAPSRRSRHVGLWTGQEFVVLGGQLPGANELLDGNRYNPETNSWGTPFQLSTAVTYMSVIRSGNELILYGRDNRILTFSLSENRQKISARLNGINDWNVDPSLVLDGNGSGSEGSLLYIFGGRASFNNTDATGSLIVLRYRPGQIEYVLLSSEVFTGLMPSYSGKYLENCCVDMLGFEFNKRIFAMNGTTVSNHSVYADVKTNSNVYGGLFNSTESVPAYKGPHSVFFESNGTTISRFTFDVSPEFDSSGYGPKGPYSYNWTHAPVWSEANRSLYWYGGRYRNLLGDTFQNGGFVFDVSKRSWTSFAPPSFEPTFVHSGVTRTYTRMDQWSFFLSGKFFVFGGYRAQNGVVPVYDGFSWAFENGIALQPQQILNGLTDEFDYSPRDNSTFANIRWAANPACVVGNEVFLSGGRRMSVRTIADGQLDSALVEHKVIFNAENSRMRVLTQDPMGLRAGTTVVSMGDSCFLWGGYTAEGAKFKPTEAEMTAELMNRFQPQESGFIFAPQTSEWRPISNTGAPSARAFMHGLWTGSEVLMWGGASEPSPTLNKDIEKNKGVFTYRPNENRWYAQPSTSLEPMFNGNERPVWTGSRVFLWKTSDTDYNYEYDPVKNEWIQLPLPLGFGFSYNRFWDSNVVWMGDRLFVMPYLDRLLGVMAIFVPPNP